MEAIILMIAGACWLVYKLFTDWLVPPSKPHTKEEMDQILGEMIGKNQKECREILKRHRK